MRFLPEMAIIWTHTCHLVLCCAGIVTDPSKSLFTYGPSGDWDFYHDVNYVPVFEPSFSSSELEQQANEVCGKDLLCIFDIAATGNVDIGSSTMESVRQQEELKQLLVPSKSTNTFAILMILTLCLLGSCHPPCVNGACISNNTCFCSEGYAGKLCDTKGMH